MILVGCPVAHRGWIIRQWADAVVTACARAGHDTRLVVAAHPDDPTPHVLRAHHPADVVPVQVERRGDRRTWTAEGPRFHEMVEVRNDLLRHVRTIAPPMFLSVDSDILLHPDAVATMIEMLDRFDAAGSACFLERAPRRRSDGIIGAPRWGRPNYARLDRNERIMRSWQPNTTRRVDVLMAIKLMSPATYTVDYRFHSQGEDIGWSLNCRAAGLDLGWTSTVISKHIMDSHCAHHEQHDPGCAACLEPLTRPDPRCGY